MKLFESYKNLRKKQAVGWFFRPCEQFSPRPCAHLPRINSKTHLFPPLWPGVHGAFESFSKTVSRADNLWTLTLDSSNVHTHAVKVTPSSWAYILYRGLFAPLGAGANENGKKKEIGLRSAFPSSHRPPRAYHIFSVSILFLEYKWRTL